MSKLAAGTEVVRKGDTPHRSRAEHSNAKFVGFVLGCLVLGFLAVWHFAGLPALPRHSAIVGDWRSLPIGYMKAGEVAYHLKPDGTGTRLNSRPPSARPVTWSQDGSRMTIVTHYTDGSAMECQFAPAPDGSSLRQTDEITHPSLHQRLLHLDFSTEDLSVPITFQKSAGRASLRP